MSDKREPQQKDSMEVYTPRQLEQSTGETAGSAIAAQAKAQIEARYIVARHKPRDIDIVRERLLRECKRPQFAAEATYTIKRGSKPIVGPSIRFAEAALREMSNIVVEVSTIYDDDEKRIVRVSTTDAEANLSYSLDVVIRKVVERNIVREGDVPLGSRVNSEGRTVYLLPASEGDLVVAQGAAVSKAIRTNGLRLVPGWLIDEALAVVAETERAANAADPDAARRKLFDAFAGLGVSADHLKAYLGHEAERLTAREREELKGLFVALRDGEITWREVEDSRASAKAEAHSTTGAEKLKARLGVSKTTGPSEEKP